MNVAINRSTLILAAALLAGCSGAAKSAEKPADPASTLVGTWTDPSAPTDNRLISVTFNADGTGSGIAKYVRQTYVKGSGKGMAALVPDVKSTVMTRTLKLAWHADAEHLYLNVRPRSDESELEYTINGNALSYGPVGQSQRYILQRARD